MLFGGELPPKSMVLWVTGQSRGGREVERGRERGMRTLKIVL